MTQGRQVRIAGGCLAAAAVAALLLLLLGGGTRATAQRHVSKSNTICQDGNICQWPDNEFTGDPKFVGSDTSAGWHSTGIYGHSTKNRFGNRKVLVTMNSGIGYFCLNPEQEEHAHPGSGYYNPGQAGSRC